MISLYRMRAIGALCGKKPVEEGMILRKTGKKCSMIRQGNDIARVKRRIQDYFSKQVDVTVNLGRNKVLRYCGCVTGVYPALFTVRPNDENFLGKTSYSYAEVLCGSIAVRPAAPAAPPIKNP